MVSDPLSITYVGRGLLHLFQNYYIIFIDDRSTGKLVSSELWHPCTMAV
jgi:hypothetical protein